MNRKEAMAALCEGKKLRRKCWPTDAYCKLSPGGMIIDHQGKPHSQFLDRPDWEIFENGAEKLAEALKKIGVLEGKLLVEYARASLDQDRQKLMQQEIDSLQKTISEMQTVLKYYENYYKGK